jgi:hypothetical protein
LTPGSSKRYARTSLPPQAPFGWAFSGNEHQKSAYHGMHSSGCVSGLILFLVVDQHGRRHQHGRRTHIAAARIYIDLVPGGPTGSGGRWALLRECECPHQVAGRDVGFSRGRYDVSLWEHLETSVHLVLLTLTLLRALQLSFLFPFLRERTPASAPSR